MRHTSPTLPILLLVLGAPLSAQEPDSIPRPDTVFAMEPLLVTASRLAAPGLGLARTSLAPASRTSPASVDIVRSAPGVFVEEAAGPGGPTILRVRGGEEVYTLVLVDGVVINQNGGFFDFLGLSLVNLGGVEVTRGPQSAVFGSSAVSGVVNFLTPRGEVGDPVVRLRAEGGSAASEGGSWLGEATVRGGTPRFRYSAGLGSAYWRGVFDLPHDTRSQNGSLRLDWAPADGWEATATGRLVHMSSKLPVRDPGATRVPLDPNARNERDREVFGVTVRRTPSARWSHYVRASRYAEAFVFEDSFDAVPQGGDFFVFDANLRFASDLVRHGVEVGGSLAAGGVEAAYGVLAERERLEDRITGDFESDPLELARSSVAGFGEAVWEASPSLSLGAGLRVERFEGLAAELSSRGALVWTPESAPWSFRVGAGRAYKAPNLQQQYVDNPFIVANPDLRAESSTSVEVGVDWVPDGSDWTAGMALFTQSFTDLIRTVAVEGDSRQTNRNLGRARGRGLEWWASGRLSGPWWLATEGALLETEILDARGLSSGEYPEGGELPFRPAYTGGLTLSYRTSGGLDVSARLRGVGAQTVLTERFSGRRVELPAYVLVGLHASWEVSPGWEVYTRLDNLTDHEYDAAFDRPGMPAAGVVGLAVRF